jgi:hypothetical protein
MAYCCLGVDDSSKIFDSQIINCHLIGRKGVLDISLTPLDKIDQQV